MGSHFCLSKRRCRKDSTFLRLEIIEDGLLITDEPRHPYALSVCLNTVSAMDECEEFACVRQCQRIITRANAMQICIKGHCLLFVCLFCLFNAEGKRSITCMVYS